MFLRAITIHLVIPVAGANLTRNTFITLYFFKDPLEQ